MVDARSRPGRCKAIEDRLRMRLPLLSCCLLASLAQAQLLAPVRSETAAVPGNQAGDTALLSQRFGDGRDLVFGTDDTNSGFYAFFVDGGPVPGLFQSFGAVGGVDALPFLRGASELTAGGVVVAAGTTAGALFLFTTDPDGGLRSVSTAALPTTAPRAVALADFGDAGAFVLTESGGSTIQRWRLEGGDGGLVPTALPGLQVGTAVRAIAVAPSLERAYLSAGLRGVLAFDPREAMPTLTPIIDAGVSVDVMSGLAVYPQRDGGAYLIAAVPAKSVYRVYRLQTGADFVAEFSVALADGGSPLTNGEWLDVWPGPFGADDGGVAFPSGVLAFTDRLSPSGGRYRLVPWEALAQQVSPPLPIDVPGRSLEPVTPPSPPRVTSVFVSEVLPASSADLALWAPRGLVFGAFDSLTALGGGSVSTLGGPGPARGVDARASGVGPFRDGLLVATASASDGGQVHFFAPQPDGGFSPGAASLPLPSTRGVAIVNPADAGAFVVIESGTTRLNRVRLTTGDAGQPLAVLETELVLPAASRALASVPGAGSVFVSAGTAIFAVDVVGGGAATLVYDAGTPERSPAGLAAVELGNGAIVLIGSLPQANAWEVFSVAPAQLTSLGRFEVTRPDGGPPVVGGVAVDATRAPFGQLPDGGAGPGFSFPNGVIGFTEVFPDGGAVVHLAEWPALVRAVPLPGGGGGSGGMGGGGPVEPEPMGCCSGAPVSASLPGLVLLALLRRFARRRSSSTLHGPE